MSGSLGGNLLCEGRACLAGHSWIRERTSPASVSITVSRTRYSPAAAARATLPAIVRGGAITRCMTNSVSRTVPIRIPGPMASPSLSAGAKGHFLSSGRLSPRSPAFMKDPEACFSRSRGRWMPSYIFPMSPGPSWMDNGLPRVQTGSPGRMPVFSS